jgi:hypothetical protein
MAIEGPLKELGIQDVLQLLELARKTGVLTVRSELQGDEALIHFDRGSIVFAVRRRSIRRLGQQLLRAGKLTQRELDHALELQRRKPMQRLGEILLEMGSVTHDELGRQLKFLLEETIYDLMAWDEGYFCFEECDEVPQGLVPLRIRVESLLMEGARRIDEWTRLEGRVPNVDSIPVLSGLVEDDAAPIDLRPEEWELLAEVDGERDLRQLAADLGRSSFDVAKMVYGLVSTGLLSIEERHAQLPEQALMDAVDEVERLLANEQPDSAAKLVTELETAHPDRPELALLAGRVLVAQGRHRAGTEAFTRAVSLDPLSVDAHYHLGFAAVRTGELERAVQAWEMYLRLENGGARGALVGRALAAVRELNQILANGVAVV